MALPILAHWAGRSIFKTFWSHIGKCSGTFYFVDTFTKSMLQFTADAKI